LLPAFSNQFSVRKVLELFYFETVPWFGTPPNLIGLAAAAFLVDAFLSVPACFLDVTGFGFAIINFLG
jgi:hypothetical protein